MPKKDSELRRAAFRYVQNLQWALIREHDPTDSIVCIKCGFEQPHVLGARCMREVFLGLECDGNHAVTAEAWSDPTFDPGDD